MSQPLAQVTSALDIPRGPDAELRLTIPGEWLSERATIECELGRRLTCAACSGGGCDTCERSGALRISGEDEQPRRVRLTLPLREPALGEFALRLPHQAGPSPDPTLPAGHLLLIFRVETAAGTQASPSVTRIATPSQDQAARDEERQRLLKRSLLVAAGLILTFVGLLRLSGWI